MPLRSKPVKVLQGERLRDQIYEYVRSQLRLGLLHPGERLKEVELARSVGASRTPVREALVQLARDGLLEERNQGYQLPEHSAKELDDRLEIRILLEPSVARHAALEANERQRLRLKKAYEDEAALLDTEDARRFLVANLAFKHELFDICRNKLLVRSARLYDDQFQYFRVKTFAARPVREVTVARHREIVAAVMAGDGDGAERAMRALLEAASEYQHWHPFTPEATEETPQTRRPAPRARVSRAAAAPKRGSSRARLPHRRS